MRVTSSSFPDTLVGQLKNLTHRQARLQEQAATGQRVVVPSDDPSAMRRVLDLQTEARGISQYRRNIAAMTEHSVAAYDAINGLKRIAARATEIATRADGLSSPEELAIFASEVTQLVHQAAELANSTHRGNYLFGGTVNDQKPFTVSVDADQNVTAVSYSGNSQVAEAEIAQGVTFTVQNPGVNNGGSGPRGIVADSRSGADLFNHLISLQNNLRAGDTDAVKNNDLPDLVADEDHLILQMADNGALRRRLEDTERIAAHRLESLEKGISAETDADLAQTLVRLNETQNAYRAALQTAGNILNQSLLDFLR